jgi:tRNA threonylcarbamoyladenosine biosynthesis protein TsaB
VKILSLETTDLSGSVAASDSSKLLLELELNSSQRSAQSLAPAIHSLLQQVGWKPADVELVAVTVGPGSFTGLRVGVTAAKTFAYAVGADVLGIDTLETIAANVVGTLRVPPTESNVAGTLRVLSTGSEDSSDLHQKWHTDCACYVSGQKQSLEQVSTQDFSQLEVVLDAQRGEVVVGTFSRSEDGWFYPSGPQHLMPIDRWLAELRPGIAVTGPILKKLQSRIPSGIMILEEPLWHPRAAQVARIAERDYAAGRRDEIWTLLPRYSRRSAAEEKLEKA